MQGAGNDYIYIDCFANKVDNLGDIQTLARRMSDRHFGVGGDGIVLIMPSDNGCDVRMRMFNSDGSEAEMCGNASRCVAKYSYEHSIVKSTEFSLQTKAGVKNICVNTNSEGIVKSATVDMGAPVVYNSTAAIPGGYSYTSVSMGNPHCVIFVDEITDEHVHTDGPKIENFREVFPQKTNVEFAKIINPQEIRMRVWERGAGITEACGTGACATLTAAVRRGLSAQKAEIRMDGGSLWIEWKNKTDILMTGKTHCAFTGTYNA